MATASSASLEAFTTEKHNYDDEQLQLIKRVLEDVSFKAKFFLLRCFLGCMFDTFKCVFKGYTELDNRIIDFYIIWSSWPSFQFRHCIFHAVKLTNQSLTTEVSLSLELDHGGGCKTRKVVT